MRWLRRMICGMLAILMSLSLSVSQAERIWIPNNANTANQLALSLFCHCAFHPEYAESDAPGKLNRWEQEITLWLGGSPTAEDRAAADAFLAELNEKVDGLPNIRRVREDVGANIRVWYVPSYLLPHYIEGYVDGNWGFFHYDMKNNRIVSARIGIATDITEQEDRIHLFKEELVGALGLPGDHEVYSDSILYDPWTVTQELSDVDWRMLNMLYHSSLTPDMAEEEAKSILRQELNIQ